MRLAENLRCQHIANVIFFILVQILTVIFILYPFEAVHQGFFCDDETIRYPYKKDTVSVAVLMISCFIPAVAMILAVELSYGLLRPRCRPGKDGLMPAEEETRWVGLRQGMAHAGLVLATFLYGNSLCYIVTEVFKLSFGRLRPSFLSACKLEEDVTSWANCSGLYVSDFRCTNPSSHVVTDIKKSFLSGHASFVTFNMLFITLYIQLRLPASAPKLLKSPLQCVAVGYAVFVCGSRLKDHMHHPQDVLAGFVLGFLFSWVTVFKVCPRFMRSPPKSELDSLPVTNPSVRSHNALAGQVSIKMEDKPLGSSGTAKHDDRTPSTTTVITVKPEDRYNSVRIEDRSNNNNNNNNNSTYKEPE